MTGVGTIDALRKDLELAKEQLKIVDDDIKRITGRDPSDRRLGDTNSKRMRTKNVGNNPARSDTVDKLSEQEIFQDVKRLIDDDLRVSVASSVVRVADTRSRQDAAKELKKSDKERGRRMLGILQGTLKQFQAESAAAIKKPQMERRRLVDAKLEAREKEEKENLRRERAELFRARREHHIEVSILQQKMRLLKKFEIWKEQQEKMKGFCRTSKSPFVFYRPKVHNQESKWRMEMTSRAIDTLIAQTLQARRRLTSGIVDPSNNKVNKTDESEKFSRNDVAEENERWSSLNDISIETKPKSLGIPKGELPASMYTSGPALNTSKNLNSSHRQDLEAGELSDGSETFALGDEPQLMEEDQHQAMYTESSNHDQQQNTRKRSDSHVSHNSPSYGQINSKRKLSTADESHPSGEAVIRAKEKAKSDPIETDVF
ncbi:unnamed protein product [Heterobilharzia americana]|nr:unnamed protein product [Heterobilharzia americana]